MQVTDRVDPGVMIELGQHSSLDPQTRSKKGSTVGDGTDDTSG